jgi:hypothetical protein
MSLNLIMDPVNTKDYISLKKSLSSFNDFNFILVYWIYKGYIMKRREVFNKMLCLEEAMEYFLFIMKIKVMK